MKSKLFLLVALAVFAFQNCKEDENEVFVPAGTNTLAQAIADIKEGWTLRLGAGMHLEDTTVVISKRICIVGDPGAVLQSNTQPRTINNLKLDVALYVLDVGGVCIRNLEIQPADNVGGTAIMFENSPNSSVEGCTITDHELSIVVQHGNNIEIKGNTIKGALFTNGLAYGIVWINGDHASITGNKISECFFGLWPCDEDGSFEGNDVTNTAYGVVPCKVVRKNMVVTPRGDEIDASITATRWKILNNVFHHNQWGVALADESNHCTVKGNTFHENGNSFFKIDTIREGYDIELVGEYPLGNNRFGVSVLPSHHNTIIANPTDKIKVCSGISDSISGGILIDLNIDPCN